VATGGSLDAGPVFLDSADGLHWNRQATKPSDALANALATGPHGVVAIMSGDSGITSWFSPDGLSWTNRKDAFRASKRTGGPSGPTSYTVSDVLATEAGWLAVGHEDPDCNFDCGGTPVRAVVWKSNDGLTWTAVRDQPALRGGGMEAVARTNGGFVAVGRRIGRAAVWTSPDGSTWSKVADKPLFHHGKGSDPVYWITMNGVAADHGVVVATGMEGSYGEGGSAVRAWWSTDGRTWHKAKGEKFASGQLFSMASTPAGFIATGPSGRPSCRGGIWLSSDGRAWSCAAADKQFEGFGPYAAAASTSIVVAVGLDGSGPDTEQGLPGAAWWAPIH
jgi:hypothetical protein